MSGILTAAQTPDPDTIDLDLFISQSAATTPASVSRTAVRPDADRVAVVGIFVDDSGSMRHLAKAVIDGLHLSIEAFKGAKGSDFFLDIRGFQRKIYNGLLKDIEPRQFESYYPDNDTTPLVLFTMEHLRDLRQKAKQYHSMGIPATISLLILTDGLPYNDTRDPREFREIIDPGDYIVGMGIANQGDDLAINKFRCLFEEMGIAKIMTPSSDPAEVRHAINEHSQSVASLAAV